MKLPNSVSFENRILRLIKELEKTTYRYINTDTKRIDSISFQNFQKPFVKQDLTCSNGGFVYTIKESPEKRNIQQITTKHFKRNNYVKVSQRANTFWVPLNGKVYQSVNWIFWFYNRLFTNWQLNFDDRKHIISSK